MAVNLRTTFSISLANVVDNAITTINAIRRVEQARKESEFQKAIAGGMSYADQITFRDKQLADEKASSISDPTYINTLTASIADTKKLARFEAIRIKYKDSLDSYVTGKESISQHLQVLQDLLAGESDPSKQSEIRDLISESRNTQATIEVNAIKNRALLAEKDKSVQLIDNSISEVQSRRALASVNQNDDEVAAWDDTLLALKSSKSKLLIENGLNEITYQTNRSSLSSVDKLNLLNNYVSSANASDAVTYDGITYPSLKAYWENKRGDYITNNFFDELKKETDAQTAVIASNNSYGQVPVARIQAINDFYSNLKNSDAFAAYQDRLEQARITSVTAMANDLYTSLVDEANANGDFAKAEAAILAIENRFGIKIARPAFSSEVANNNTIANSVLGGGATVVNPAAAPIPAAAQPLPSLPVRPSVTIPSSEASPASSSAPAPLGANISTTFIESTPTPVPASTPAPNFTPVPPNFTSAETGQPAYAPPPTPIPPQNFTPVPAPTPNYSEAVPLYSPASGVGTKSPGGQYVFTADYTWKPVGTTSITKTAPVPVPPPFPTPPPATIPVSVPTPNPTTTTPSTYTGVSVVDYLKLQKQDSSFSARQKLALEKGIMNYTGTGKQNDQLLKLLRG
jgi:hypothetical protein